MSEAETEAMKKEKKDEWERVGKPEVPIAVFEELQEQRDIKEREEEQEE